MNPLRLGPDQSAAKLWDEDATMLEFTDIFVFGLTTDVYVLGSIAMLIGLALSAMAMARKAQPEFALQGALQSL